MGYIAQPDRAVINPSCGVEETQISISTTDGLDKRFEV